MKKESYTKAEYQTAQSQSIISYLNSIGYQLKSESGYHKGVLHNSLVIKNDGKWNWNSRNISGKLPVELLKNILMEDFGYAEKDAFINAIKRLAGTEGQTLRVSNNSFKPRTINSQTPSESKKTESEPLKLPPKSDSLNRSLAYLCKTRGLDYEIIKELIIARKIYETKDSHNACFVASDKDGVPKHAFLRWTLTNTDRAYKNDVKNSDKSFAFTIDGNKNATKVFCFEGSIDEISHASLYKLNNLDYKDAHRISLHGTSFLGLEKFLKDNPQIKEIVSCLDNDPTGLKRSEKMCEKYSQKGYKMFKQPSEAKDYNIQLLNAIEDRKESSNDLFEDMER